MEELGVEELAGKSGRGRVEELGLKSGSGRVEELGLKNGLGRVGVEECEVEWKEPGANLYSVGPAVVTEAGQ